MLAKLVTVFKIPELRQKIWITLILLAVYRMGHLIPLPVIDQKVMAQNIKNLQSNTNDPIGQALKIAELFSASNFGMTTIFGMGIMPYISASIILQLLASVYPPLEQLQKEGEAGRKKINEYTRYFTVFLAFFQSLFWFRSVISGGAMGASPVYPSSQGMFTLITCAMVMTAGTVLLMWIGEQIDEYGIGNGISLLIMAGIIGRMPSALAQVLGPAFKGQMQLGSDMGIEKLLVLGVMFISVIVGVIFITQGQRKIPTQSAKHVRGRRVWGGQKQYLPLRVNQAGVMPIIFASSLLMFPTFLFQWLNNAYPNWTWVSNAYQAFSGERGFIYNLSYIALIYFFCYFWTAITFNPKEIANNLKDYGSFIPGHRPGKRTADYLERVMVRITYVGAAFLAVVAVTPTLVHSFMGIDYMTASFFGGTGLLIVVSVALDLVQKIDSHLVMRNYGGLLEDS